MQLESAIIGAVSALTGVVVSAVIEYFKNRQQLKEKRKLERQRYLASLLERLISARSKLNAYGSMLTDYVGVELSDDIKILQQDRRRMAHFKVAQARAEIIAVCLAAGNAEISSRVSIWHRAHIKGDATTALDEIFELFSKSIAGSAA